MIDEAQEARNAAYRKTKAETDVLLAEVDELLATRHEPLTNVIPLPRKPPPPSEPDPIVTRMIEELRSQLDEHCDYVNNELASVLTQVFNDVADQFESLRLDLQSLRNLQNKYVEADIDALKAETAALRSDFSSLQTIVGNLSGQIAQLADDMASIERSNKIVSFRGAS